MESEFKSFIGTLLESIQEEIQEETQKNAKDFQQIFDKLIKAYSEIHNPEKYNILIRYQIDKLLGELIKKLNPDIKNNNQLLKVFFIYQNYRYLSDNISNFIARIEGRACCVDKSRWIIKRYKDYITNGDIPDMTIDDKCYWKPHWGTGKQWMDFCIGLVSFYYGNPEKYMLTVKDLLIREREMLTGQKSEKYTHEMYLQYVADMKSENCPEDEIASEEQWRKELIAEFGTEG